MLHEIVGAESSISCYSRDDLASVPRIKLFVEWNDADRDVLLFVPDLQEDQHLPDEGLVVRREKRFSSSRCHQVIILRQPGRVVTLEWLLSPGARFGKPYEIPLPQSARTGKKIVLLACAKKIQNCRPCRRRGGMVFGSRAGEGKSFSTLSRAPKASAE